MKKSSASRSAGAVIGAAVRQLRKDRGWTLEELSEQTDISVPGLSKLETGKTTRVRKENLARLASALNVSEDELDPVKWAARVASEAITLEQRRLVDMVLSLPMENAADAKSALAALAKRHRRKG